MGAFDMRKLLPGSVALIALGLSVPAMAADLEVGAPAYKAVRPVVRAYDWSGFYVGGNVGGHWGTDKITTVTDPTGGFGAGRRRRHRCGVAGDTAPARFHRWPAGGLEY